MVNKKTGRGSSAGMMTEEVITLPAQLWKRFIAFLLDVFVMSVIILGPFEYILNRVTSDVGSGSGIITLLSGASVLSEAYLFRLQMVEVAIGLLMLLYFIKLERVLGQSIGKMIMDIRVVSEKENYSLFQNFVRNMFFIPVFPFSILWLIDPLFMIFNKENRRLSEILSKTRTVEDHPILDR